MQRPAAAADDDEDGASVPCITLRPLPPLFPASTWNLHVATLNGNHRTNNQCEAWNRVFAALVAHNQHLDICYLVTNVYD